jgi:hypothetical protein
MRRYLILLALLVGPLASWADAATRPNIIFILADDSIKVEPVMDVNHVASMVLHMANLPLETNVQFVTIMATKMPLVGRG